MSLLFPFTDLLSKTTDILIKDYILLKKNVQKEEQETDEWRELEKAYLNHLKWRFSYPKKTFGQQKAISVAIGCLVIILILSGIIFSFWQLKYALEVGSIDKLNSQISIETAGKITISSSILGSIVLVISLAFFYLYLTNVFKIEYPTPPNVNLEDGDIKEILMSKALSRSKNKKNDDEELAKLVTNVLVERDRKVKFLQRQIDDLNKIKEEASES